MDVTTIKKPSSLSLYSYYGEGGKEVLRAQPLNDGTYEFMHKDHRRHWRKGWPDTFREPYALHEVRKADPAKVVYVVHDEADAQRLLDGKLLAVCFRDWVFTSTADDYWLAPFAGRIVVHLVTPEQGTLSVSTVLARLLPAVDAQFVQVTLDGLDQGEGVQVWLHDRGNNLDQLQATVYDAVCRLNDPGDNGPAEDWNTLPSEPVHVQPEDDEDAEHVHCNWRPFPIDALPECMANYVLAASRALHCDPAYVALPALIVAGGAIGNARLMRLKETWLEPSVFWGMVIADSSTMKSPAADIARAPLSTLQAELFMEFERELTGYKRKLRQWEDTPRDQRSTLTEDGGGDGPQKPTPRRIAVEDITCEKLAAVLYDNPRGLTLVTDELAGWLGSFTRYQSGKGGGTNLPFWLEVFRAKGKMIDRKGGDTPSLWVNRLAVSVFGTIQPSTVMGFFSEQLVESGFASRILMAMPPRIPKKWSEDVIPADIKRAYQKMIVDLYALDTPHSHQRMYNPREVEFTPDGKIAWEEWYNFWADRQSNSEGETAYALAKLEAYCARFALLLATVDGATLPDQSGHVEAGHVCRAVQLVDWFAQEAERVYTMLRTPAQFQESQRLLEYIQARGGKITPRRLFLSNPSRYLSVANVKNILEGYVTNKKGRWVTKAPGAQGGRSSLIFTLLPNETKPNET